MNYAQARQRQTDGRWDWSVRNDDLTWPAGYCAGWKDWTPEGAHVIGVRVEQLRADQESKSGLFRAKYHTDGHTTKEEAERCWWEYEIDQELREMERASSGSHEERWRCQARWVDREEWQQERVVAVLERYVPYGDRSCDQWTTKALGVGYFGETYLCDAHRHRDVYAALHPFAPGRAMSYS